MTRPLFHTDMMTRLADFYPSLCTIKNGTETQDPNTGEITTTWANFAGHVDLPCALAATTGREVKVSDQVYVEADFTLSLASSHPDITEKMRAEVGAIAYDIVLVQTASHGMATHLLLMKVT